MGSIATGVVLYFTFPHKCHGLGSACVPSMWVSPSGFCSSDSMTPLWYPCLRVCEAVSHYLFNVAALPAQPRSSEITFLPRTLFATSVGREAQIKKKSKTPFLYPSWLSSPSACVTPSSRSTSSLYDPDAELREPGQREQPRDPCQGAQLWHHHAGQGEDPGCRVQEHALLVAAAGCRHGPWWGCSQGKPAFYCPFFTIYALESETLYLLQDGSGMGNVRGGYETICRWLVIERGLVNLLYKHTHTHTQAPVCSTNQSSARKSVTINLNDSSPTASLTPTACHPLPNDSAQIPPRRTFKGRS